MPLILQTLSPPISNPYMLLWSTALFQFHYTLYEAFQLFLSYASNRKVCSLPCLHQDKYLISCLQNFLPTKFLLINWRNPYLIDVQLYGHLYVGMLSRNRLHIKTNQNERCGVYD